MKTDIVVGIATKLRAGQSKTNGLILGRVKGLEAFFERVQLCSEVYLTSHIMSTCTRLIPLGVMRLGVRS